MNILSTAMTIKDFKSSVRRISPHYPQNGRVYFRDRDDKLVEIQSLKPLRPKTLKAAGLPSDCLGLELSDSE